jgi:hypothetical protein
VNNDKSFNSSTVINAMTIAERELAAYVGAVTEFFGSDQARLAAEDWLEELESVESLPGTTTRDWRLITTAVLPRLANRLTLGLHHRAQLFAASATKALPLPSSNRSAPLI